jgi:hypothetical protein
VSNYVAAVVNRFSNELAEQRLAALGLRTPGAVRLESRCRYNAP